MAKAIRTVAEWERVIPYQTWEDYGFRYGNVVRKDRYEAGKGTVASAYARYKPDLEGLPATYVRRAKKRFYAGFKKGTMAAKKKNPSVRTAPKSAIPAKFVTAKVRRVGSKVQILLNK